MSRDPIAENVKTPDEKNFWVQSGYGINTRKPFVAFHWQDVVFQVDVEKAREIAGMIFQAAEAAETDGFIFEWIQEETKVDEKAARVFLGEYRKWRDERRAS